MSVLLAFLSLLIERFAGYPEPLLKAVGHPVTWIGGLVGWLDRNFNRDEEPEDRRRRNGIIAAAVIVLVPTLAAAALGGIFSLIPLGIVLAAIVATSLVAQRSLEDHVSEVADALEIGGAVAGCKAVSRIVGRDTELLDEAGVARAAIESLAENFSDGVVAPAFWLSVGGLAGGAAYKAINTADSMIGHRTARHQAFGWASARLDDLVNLPASRLSALLIVCAAAILPGASAGEAWRVMVRDARRHRSPNAGWPEAAMAGALGLALAGPRVYDGEEVADAVMGRGGRREATAEDIRRAIRVYWLADVMLIVLVGLLALLLVA